MGRPHCASFDPQYKAFVILATIGVRITAAGKKAKCRRYTIGSGKVQLYHGR